MRFLSLSMRATVTIAYVTLGKVGSHLGQGLVGRKADTDGHAHAPPDTLVQVLSPFLDVHLLHVVEIDETFVDAVAKIGRCLLTNNADHTARQFAIKFVIAGKDSNLFLWEQLGQLIIGHPRLDAQFLRFVTTRNDTPIVVRKYNDGRVLQIRTKDALARNVAVIAVDDSVHPILCGASRFLRTEYLLYSCCYGYGTDSDDFPEFQQQDTELGEEAGLGKDAASD